MINPLLAKYVNQSVYDLFHDPKFMSTLRKMGYTIEYYVPESKKLSGNMVIRRNVHLSTRAFIKLPEIQKLLYIAGWRYGSQTTSTTTTTTTTV